MIITREIVQQAVRATTGRGNRLANEYRLANWLRDEGYHFSMGELREMLGTSADDIDPEIRRGINGTLERMGQ
jgi:hypothetical protein